MYHYHIHDPLSAPHNMYWVCMTSIRLAAFNYEKDQRNTLVEFNRLADTAMDKYVDDFLKWSLMVDPRPWSPDGKRIVFVDTGPTRRINFLDELEDFEDE